MQVVSVAAMKGGDIKNLSDLPVAMLVKLPSEKRKIPFKA